MHKISPTTIPEFKNVAHAGDIDCQRHDAENQETPHKYTRHTTRHASINLRPGGAVGRRRRVPLGGLSANASAATRTPQFINNRRSRRHYIEYYAPQPFAHQHTTQWRRLCRLTETANATHLPTGAAMNERRSLRTWRVEPALPLATRNSRLTTHDSTLPPANYVLSHGVGRYIDDT